MPRKDTERVESFDPTHLAEQKPPGRATRPVLTAEDFTELAESLPLLGPSHQTLKSERFRGKQ
jgi:hypothetical protein